MSHKLLKSHNKICNPDHMKIAPSLEPNRMTKSQIKKNLAISEDVHTNRVLELVTPQKKGAEASSGGRNALVKLIQAIACESHFEVGT